MAEVSVQLLGPVTVRLDDAAVKLAGTLVASLGEDVYDSERRAGIALTDDDLTRLVATVAAGLSTPEPIR